jgi:LmbE family N-acetylglucosaminyl deacetylase
MNSDLQAGGGSSAASISLDRAPDQSFLGRTAAFLHLRAADAPRHRSSIVFPRVVELSQAAAMRPFRERPVVVLSPHFDDACYSLGAFLASLGSGTLINIFTQGTYLAHRHAAAAHSQKSIYEIRDGEDQAFGERCGLTRFDLGCEEPALRGRRIRDLRHVEDDIAQITGPILRTLDKVAATFHAGERGFLFVPLGVGQHSNHRATHEAVLRKLGTIEKRFDVLFYEEQPYSSFLFQRFGALGRLCRRGTLSVRYVLTPAWPAKKALIDLYPTQQRRSPKPSRFWPRAVWPLAPHEAFWPFAANSRAAVGE